MERPTLPSAAEPPGVVDGLFGDRAPQLRAFATHLETTGVEHGLIGPREAARLWDRHLLNCAVVEPALPRAARVADIGSGAGLPGLVLAIARPDVHVTLVEPLERRTRWLQSVVADLGLQVAIEQAKVERLWGRLTVDVVVARAVASLGELARMSLPLLRVGGRMVALKGDRAHAELAADRGILDELGATDPQIRTYGEEFLETPTTAVLLTQSRPAPRWREPVGDGPARTAARKKERRRARAASRRDEQGR